VNDFGLNDRKQDENHPEKDEHKKIKMMPIPVFEAFYPKGFQSQY
jgi:hypothetical protein